MQCLNCGTPLPEGAAACPACGTAATQPGSMGAAQPAPPAPNALPVNPAGPTQAAPQPTPPPQGWQQPPPAAPQPPYGSAPQQAWQPAAQQPPAPAAAPPQPTPPPQGWQQPPAGAPAQPWQPAPQPPAPGQPAYGAPPPPYGGAPAYAMAGAPGPASPKKKMKKGAKIAIVIILVVAILAAALAVYFIAFAGGSPKQQVRDAFTNTMDALESERTAAQQALGTDKIFSQFYEGPVEMDYHLSMSGLSGMPDEVSMSGSLYANLPDRQLSADIALGLGSMSLLDMQLALEDDLVALACPQLFSGSYGVHTETLGYDLYDTEAYYYMDIESDTSFNIFDMMALPDPSASGQEEPAYYTPETSAELTRLFDTMWETAVVEKTGNQQVSINGFNKSCDVFTVQVEVAVLVDYLQDVVDVLLDDKIFGSAVLSAYLTANGSYYTEDDLRYEIEYRLSDLEYYVEEAGATVYVADKKLVRLDIELSDGYDDVLVSMEIGGEKNMSDAFRLLVSENGYTEIEVSMQGHQVAEDGLYSLSGEIYGGYESVYFEYEFDTTKSSDNFRLSFEAPGAEARIYGTMLLDNAAGTLYLDLYDIELYDGYNTYYMALETDIAPGGSFSGMSPTLLSSMSDDEIEDLFWEMEENLYTLLYSMY